MPIDLLEKPKDLLEKKEPIDLLAEKSKEEISVYDPSFQEHRIKPILQTLGFIQTPMERIAKAQNVYAEARIKAKQMTKDNPELEWETTKQLIPQIDENWDDYVEQEYGLLTTKKANDRMYQLMITAGLAPVVVAQPLKAAIGVGTFATAKAAAGATLYPAIDFIEKKIQNRPYHYKFIRDITELLPEESTQATEDIITMLEFIGLSAIAGGIIRKSPAIAQKLTKNILVKYKMPQEIYLSPEKVKSIYQTGEKIGAEELDLYKEINLSGKEIRIALKKGINVKIPAEKIVSLVDKPYWAKIKGIFNVQPIEITRISKAGQIQPVKGALPLKEGAKVVPPGKVAVRPQIAPKTPIVGVEPPEISAKIENIVEQGGGKFKGMSTLENSIFEGERTVYFDDAAGSTKILPESKVTIENVKAKIEPKTGIAEIVLTKPKSIKPDISGIAPLQRRIQAIEERKERVKAAQSALEETNTIREYLKKGLDKNALSEKELGKIPKIFIAKKGGLLLPEALTELEDRFNIKIESKAEFFGYLKNIEQIRGNLIEEIKAIQPQLITKRETTLLKERIQATEQGIREGKIQAKKNIKAVQEELIEKLEESEIEAKDRAKFIRSIKNVQTAEQLSKALPKIAERVANIEEQAAKNLLISDIKENTRKSVTKKLRPEYQKPILDLIDNIDVAPRSDKKIRSLEKTLAFLEENPDNQIPQSRINELKRLEQTPIRDLSLEQLRDISDSINHLIKLNDLKNKLIIRGKLKEINEVTYQAVKNLNIKHEQLNGSLDGLDSIQEEKERPLWQKIWGVDSLGAEDKSIILDGEDKGVIFQVLYEGIDKGVDAQFKIEHNAEDFFKEKLKNVKIENWSRAFQSKEANIEKVKIKISQDREIVMTKAERVSFILHSRNSKNMKHLEKGGFAFEKTKSKINKLTREDIEAIIASATPEEFEVADAIGEYLDTLQKNEINKISVKLDGFEIAKEKDYWHIRTDYLDRIKETIIKKGNYSQKTLEGMGIFKERQNASNAIILEDAFIALYRSIKQSAAYIGLAGPLRAAKTLLNNNDFQKAAINAAKKHYIDSLKDYISRIEGESLRMENLDKLTTEWINRLDTSILGLNPFVALKQRISWFLAGTEMNWEILRKHPPKSPTTEELTEMKTWHPQLRDRLDGNVTRELGEVAQVGRVRKFFTGKEATLKLQSIRDNDTMVITAIWNAVKEEISTAKPSLTGNDYWKEVAEKAWEIIRRTQPTFHIKDRSTIGMSRQLLWRLSTKYSSQRNKNWRIARRAFEEYNRSAKTSRDKANLATALFTVGIVNALFIVLINSMRRTLFAKKDKDFMKKIFKGAIMDAVVTPLSNIYILGEVISSLASKIDKGTYAGYDIENPVTSTVNDITDTLANGSRAIYQSITNEKYKGGERRGQEKWINSLKRFAEGVFDTAGRIIGINLKNIRQFFKIPFTFKSDRTVLK